MPQSAILDEYENGCAAIRGRSESYVQTPDEKVGKFEFGSSARDFNNQRARVYAALYVQLGPVPLLDDDDAIPVKVATAGKPAIAAYLFANHARDYYTVGESVRDVYRRIANPLDVGIHTVQKYLRRVLREVQDKRIGGIAR